MRAGRGGGGAGLPTARPVPTSRLLFVAVLDPVLPSEAYNEPLEDAYPVQRAAGGRRSSAERQVCLMLLVLSSDGAGGCLREDLVADLLKPA